MKKLEFKQTRKKAKEIIKNMTAKINTQKTVQTGQESQWQPPDLAERVPEVYEHECSQTIE